LILPAGMMDASTTGNPQFLDLNPIEQVFAKIKHWMRMAQARTIYAMNSHIANLVTNIQPQECANYIANAGYASV